MNAYSETLDQLLDAALMHVPFDGWSEATFRAAIQDADISHALARSICPRGALDLAIAYHRRGDAKLEERLSSETLPERFRDKIAAAVRFRLEVIEDKEAVRRGTTLFALPMHAADGAKLIWGTSDRIWEALGDTSEDYNWYTKRATLSGVYSATVLYWLGDDSVNSQATWDFLDRRIDNVMQIEKLKKNVSENKVLSAFMVGPNWMLSQIRPPKAGYEGKMPGRWTPPQ